MDTGDSRPPQDDRDVADEADSKTNACSCRCNYGEHASSTHTDACPRPCCPAAADTNGCSSSSSDVREATVGSDSGGATATTTTKAEAGPFRFFDELPRELFFKILGYLSLRELCLSVAPVCRDWRDCARSPLLWQHLDLAEGGGSGARDVSHQQLCALLAGAPSLRSLSLRGREQLCLSELHLLAGCPLLTRLNLGFCDKVNGRILHEVVRCCPNLEVRLHPRHT